MSYSFLPSSAQRIGVRRASLWSIVVSATQRLFEQLAHRRVVRRDLNSLMEFDDRQLADIGLNRGELLHAVRYGRLPKHSNQRDRGACSGDAALRG
jgi:uncharacterized protein YjiS (DUF1127 family)